MPPTNLQLNIETLLSFMDGNIDKVEGYAIDLQKKVYDLVRRKLLEFNTTDGRIDVDQKWQRSIAQLGVQIESLFGNATLWADPISEFLSSFQTIQDINVKLNRTYNELEVDVSLLSPARKYIYDQAEHALKTGIRYPYIEPVKMLLMQQVTSGASITDSLALLERWDKGELTNGKQTNGRVTPNLQRYATQIARDTSYAVDRNISGIIKERYGLDDVMYVGGLVSDSRPFCVHMVKHQQPVSMETVEEYIKLYPQGLYPETDRNNFMQRCGGYACRHKAFAVRKRP